MSGPGACRADRTVRALVSTMSPPTALPRIRPGSLDTSQAAIGAATRPPASSAPTTTGLIPAVPSPARNPAEAARATMNSEVSTLPMTVRGAVRPRVSSVVVATGPQPPPPVASTKPPTRPNRARNRTECGLRRTVEPAGGRTAKRTRTYSPSASRRLEAMGAAASVLRCDRTTAPRSAPAAPGRPRRATSRQSVLPSRWWAVPEMSVVPISDRWTLALARAGPIPASRSSEEEVTP